MDRAELERRAEAAVRARWGRNPELDDLLVIARTAIELELRAGTAPERLAQYSLARVLGDCRDHLRMVARQDPLRRPLRIQHARTRRRSVKISCRVPVELLANAAVAADAASITVIVRRALESIARN
jgi:hypothetical protein